MNPPRLDDQIRFILELDKLKGVLRRSYLCDNSRLENSAEHSWHVATMATLLAEHANEPVDVPRVVRMLLIHDVVEIDAGDTFRYDAAGYADKLEREMRAADRLFGLLPADQAAALRGLWEEYEARESNDAKFANALDRLMPIMQNYHSGGRTWREHGVRHGQVIEHNRCMAEGSQVLWRFVRAVLDDAVAKGYLAP